MSKEPKRALWDLRPLKTKTPQIHESRSRARLENTKLRPRDGQREIEGPTSSCVVSVSFCTAKEAPAADTQMSVLHIILVVFVETEWADQKQNSELPLMEMSTVPHRIVDMPM